MKKYDFTPIEEFLSREMPPALLAAELEDVLWRYVDMLLRSGEASGPSVAGQVCWLRSFMDTLKSVDAGG